MQNDKGSASLPTPGRYHTLWTTNEAPQSSEITFLKSVISKADARLAWIDQELSKLRDTVMQLEEERASLSDALERNKAVLAPHRRLPTEILDEIFRWTLPSLEEQIRFEEFDIEESPWILTHVCVRWRAISCSRPWLWSTITLNHSSSTSIRDRLSLLRTQIDRSRHLKVHFYASEETDLVPQLESLQLLVAHSSRWEELSVGLTAGILPYLDPIRGRLSVLKRLWIDWLGSDEVYYEDSLDLFHVAPSLVDFGTFSEDRFSSVAFPAHQLTRYQLEGSWERHEAILKLAAPQLVEAHIAITDPDVPWPYPGEPIILPRLLRLYVSDTEVLDYVETPALVGLAFDAYIGSTDVSPHLAPFFDRSRCRPSRLSLPGFPDAHVTSQMLQKFPFITDLFLLIEEADAQEGADQLVSALTVTDSEDNAVAPHLRSICFASQNDSFIDYTRFLAMIRSRWRATRCTLETAVLLTEGPSPDSETLQGIDTLQQEGLDFTTMDKEDPYHHTIRKRWCYATPWN
ncbi:F-box domain-containing protein [Favolaschia claudopus]|uniref:F-box domain-containing protein n=1 Tax=Favolaschia claudopus TaxID=2862362 RepID=A0AAW0BX39_9AGAR